MVVSKVVKGNAILSINMCAGVVLIKTVFFVIECYTVGNSSCTVGKSVFASEFETVGIAAPNIGKSGKGCIYLYLFTVVIFSLNGNGSEGRIKSGKICFKTFFAEGSVVVGCLEFLVFIGVESL